MPVVAVTTLRADPAPVRRWVDPGEPGWVPARVRRRRGVWSHFAWCCPNHPETRSGAIRGTTRYAARMAVMAARARDGVPWRPVMEMSRLDALDRLHEHFRRYHGAP